MSDLAGAHGETGWREREVFRFEHGDPGDEHREPTRTPVCVVPTVAEYEAIVTALHVGRNYADVARLTDAHSDFWRRLREEHVALFDRALAVLASPEART